LTLPEIRESRRSSLRKNKNGRNSTSSPNLGNSTLSSEKKRASLSTHMGLSYRKDAMISDDSYDFESEQTKEVYDFSFFLHSNLLDLPFSFQMEDGSGKHKTITLVSWSIFKCNLEAFMVGLTFHINLIYHIKNSNVIEK
jgi:hypothetical protein